MKKFLITYSIFILLIFTLPVITVTLGGLGTGGKSTSPGIRKYENARKIKLFNHKTGEVTEIDCEEYLYGVVSAEMPAEFPLEALKAQAVAARSYLENKLLNGSNNIESHKGADICTDSAHCKAWISKQDRFDAWNSNDANNYWNKIVTAVDETKGEIMVYDGKPVNAVFYAISSGKTERACEVWQSDVPYLQSVESPYDVNAPGYLSTAEFTYDEFKEKLKAYDSEVSFDSDNPGDWYKNEKRSEGGGVLSCEIGGKTFKGLSVRTALGLRSHNYLLEIKDGKFVFTVKGYGHGVGMSQWGARFYAEEGKNYRDILRLYYQGIGFDNIYS